MIFFAHGPVDWRSGASTSPQKILPASDDRTGGFTNPGLFWQIWVANLRDVT